MLSPGAYEARFQNFKLFNVHCPSRRNLSDPALISARYNDVFDEVVQKSRSDLEYFEIENEDSNSNLYTGRLSRAFAKKAYYIFMHTFANEELSVIFSISQLFFATPSAGAEPIVYMAHDTNSTFKDQGFICSIGNPRKNFQEFVIRSQSGTSITIVEPISLLAGRFDYQGRPGYIGLKCAMSASNKPFANLVIGLPVVSEKLLRYSENTVENKLNRRIEMRKSHEFTRTIFKALCSNTNYYSISNRFWFHDNHGAKAITDWANAMNSNIDWIGK
jgi:hypothetical protein